MKQPRGPFLAVVDAFGSLWCGIILATILFIYCSVGSAMPTIRQLPSIEKTEFEWFCWWPFSALIVLFCASLILSTIRRIPFRVANLGVWTIHAGIIVLAIGSYYYFGTKVEGDAPVFRRSVTIELPGVTDKSNRVVAVKGAHKEVIAGPDLWKFDIADTNPSWPLLSDADKGKTAFAVNVRVSPPNGEPFIRQLLDGYPQYTEDVIPGKGRAIKSTGKKLLDENLRLALDYEPQEYFHIQDTWALFLRRAGDREWVERPIEGLPRYNNRIASRDQVFNDPSDPLVIRAIDLSVPTEDASHDALAGDSVHVTGYLRYARLDRQWRDGGDRWNPVLQLTANAEGMEPRAYELAAFDPAQNSAGDGVVQFVWLNDASRIVNLPTDSNANMQITVPAANVDINTPITEQSINGDMIPIKDTDFAYRILGLNDNLHLPGIDHTVSIAVVEIRTPEGVIRRWVADDPERTRDLRGGDDPHNAAASPPDPRVKLMYHPASAPILFAAYPGGLHFRFNGPSGQRIDRDPHPGEFVDVTSGLSIRVDALWERAISQEKPRIIPPSEQQSKAGETFSMIRLEVDAGRGATQTKWVSYTPYAFTDQAYAASGRFSYAPVRFTTPKGDLEVLFSRHRMKLPAPIALDNFTLDAHLGGYTGSALTIRNYLSQLRFFDGGNWTPPVEIAVNQPTAFGGLHYFQSSWDPPDERTTGSGMCFTGLGIGNRNGVGVQLAGCCMAVAGMIFAFYVKPMLRRKGSGPSGRRDAAEADEQLRRPRASGAKLAATGVRSESH
ncbi:MAG: hypothetical protein HY287_06785 [Planctomycetes bacterium]|nr:hypothetical protein [Planctomycetota bacterium]MBI3834020.1 hypothetical protein [Planctomycetota bacterium]